MLAFIALSLGLDLAGEPAARLCGAGDRAYIASHQDTDPAMRHAFPLLLAALALAGCSTLDEVVAYGKGPFDHGPLPRSETALEGLHESSWGNSGKWGKSEAKDDSAGASSGQKGAR
jgi:hypothetical protein